MMPCKGKDIRRKNQGLAPNVEKRALCTGMPTPKKDGTSRTNRSMTQGAPPHLLRGNIAATEKQQLKALPDPKTFAETTINHASLRKTAFCDNSCSAHRESKDTNGWYPKAPNSKA